MAKKYAHCNGETGEITVRMTMAQAKACSHPGECDADVRANIDAVEWVGSEGTLRRLVKSTGAWDDWATADLDAIKRRVLWMAAGDIAENPKLY